MNSDYSVVVLSYNHPEITRRCLSSLLEAGQDPANIILVHNGSDKNCVLSLQKKYPEVQHLLMPKNLGSSGGTNAGLKEAFRQSEWALFLTNDTEILTLPRKGLREPALIAPLVYRRKTSVVASRLGFFNPQWGEVKYLMKAQEFANLPVHGFLFAPGVGFFLNREVFEKVGAFDESLGTGWEDVDFSVRVQELGFQVKHDPQISLVHFVSKTCQRKPIYQFFLQPRNRIRVSLRYISRPHLWCLRSVLAKDFLVTSVRLLFAGRGQDCLMYCRAQFESFNTST